MISGVSARGLGYTNAGSLFPLRLDQVFGCSLLEVWHVVECGWPFSGLIRKAILTQAKTELPSDTIQLITPASQRDPVFPYVIENKNLWQPDL